MTLNKHVHSAPQILGRLTWTGTLKADQAYKDMPGRRMRRLHGLLSLELRLFRLRTSDL